MHGRAVEGAVAGRNHPGVRKRSVGRALKTMRYALDQRSTSEFEDRATARSTLARCPVKVSARVKDEIADGTVSVTSRPETVEHSFIPLPDTGGRQPIDSTHIICSAVVSRAVDIATAVKKQSAIRENPVRLALE